MKASTRSWLISVLVHLAIVALLFTTGKVTGILPSLQDHGSIVLPSDLIKYQVTRSEKAGGGGGQLEKDPPRLGHPPKASLRPFVPPTTHIENAQPVLSMEMAVYGAPAIAIPLLNLPVVGDPTGIRGTDSAGPGGPNGIGRNGSGGIGNQDGTGVGPGGEPGVGGRSGIRDDVSQPTLITKIEPTYTDEARKVKLQGSVFLRIVVNERGRAESMEVTQGLGLGLDERAIEAVKQWRFHPGMRKGQPVPTTAIIQVTFRLL